MRQEQFEATHEADWAAFEQWLAREKMSRWSRRRGEPPFPEQEVPERYRLLCQNLAIARSRGYGLTLVDRLHRLALDGHDWLYGTPGGWGQRWIDWLLYDFPAEVRAHWRSVSIACALFYGPYFLLMAVVRIWPEFAYNVLPDKVLDNFDFMYGPEAKSLGQTRGADNDLGMFGYYIFNNIGIGFRCYAGGVFAGLGTLYTLLYNGLFMGVVEAHVVNLGHAERFYSFVSGHSSFELTAIVLCGAAGLQLGWAVLSPGQGTRGAALRKAARGTIGIVSGAAVMLLIAAMIEAFWSPRLLPPSLKYGVGLFNWLLVLAYLTMAGKHR